MVETRTNDTTGVNSRARHPVTRLPVGQALPIYRFATELLRNWNRGEGPCRDCPSNKVREQPEFAMGSGRASILNVAQNPGGKGHLGRRIRRVGYSALDPWMGFELGAPRTKRKGARLAGGLVCCRAEPLGV